MAVNLRKAQKALAVRIGFNLLESNLFHYTVSPCGNEREVPRLVILVRKVSTPFLGLFRNSLKSVVGFSLIHCYCLSNQPSGY